MSYSSVILADAPLGFWRLAEGSGVAMVDASGNGHNGTYTTPAWVANSIPGDAAASSLSQAAAGGGVVTGLAGPVSGSAECWFKTTASPAGDQCIMNAFGFKVGFKGAQLRKAGPTDGNTFSNTSNNPVAINDGNWHYIFMLWTNANGAIYVDGLFAGTTAGGAATSTFGVLSVDGSTLPAQGQGADFACYGSLLGNPQAERHYGAGITGIYGLASWTDLIDVMGVFTYSSNTPGGPANIIPVLRPNGSTTSYSAAADSGYHVELTANCTGLSLFGFFSTNPVSISVDGAAPTNVVPAAGYGTVALATGLAAGNHLFRLSFDVGGHYLSRFVLSGGTQAVTSTARPQTAITSNIANTNFPNVASPITRWGSNKVSTYFVTAGSYFGLTFEFSFVGTGLDILCTADNGISPVGIYQLVVDGGPAQLIQLGWTSPATNGIKLYMPVVSGLANGTHTISMLYYGGNALTKNFTAFRVHNGTTLSAPAAAGNTTITVAALGNIAIGSWLQIGVLPSKELRQVSGVAGNVLTVAALTNSYAAGAAVTSYGDAGTGSLGVWAARNATGGKVAAIGDSVTQGASPMYGAGTTVPPDTYFADWAASQVGGQFYDVRNSYLTRLAKLLGWNDANMGIQGTTAANMAGRGAADFPAYAANANATIIFAGINDVNNGTSLAGFQSSYQTLIT
ncbi:MAG: cell surface protein, partial [Chloroflexi bacterium]|nr:cell surface protein [Chloroflexota bacterium]